MPLREGQALLETEQIKPEHSTCVVRRELPTLLPDQEVQSAFFPLGTAQVGKGCASHL